MQSCTFSRLKYIFSGYRREAFPIRQFLTVLGYQLPYPASVNALAEFLDNKLSEQVLNDVEIEQVSDLVQNVGAHPFTQPPLNIPTISSTLPFTPN